MKIIVGVCILTFALYPLRAFANDGFGALGIGGVTLSKTDSIAIQQETLDISCDNIKVAYDFINESSKDETAQVIFPLPPYPAMIPESGIISHGEPLGFSISVNGKSVEYQTTVKATLEGNDVTDTFKGVGLSEKQIAHIPFEIEWDGNQYRIPLTTSQIKGLEAKGLVEDGAPIWEIHINYVWSQRFPSNTKVHIEHSYRPFNSVGSVGGFYGETDLSEFCLRKEQMKELENLYSNEENRDESFNGIPGTIVKYILTTANSWKDGIRDFRLRLHTKSKEEIVALCFPYELHKVSDTLHEAHVVNFRPSSELSIYYGNAKSCQSEDYGLPPRLNSK
jgi:hypothetical protein